MPTLKRAFTSKSMTNFRAELLLGGCVGKDGKILPRNRRSSHVSSGHRRGAPGEQGALLHPRYREN